MSEPRKSGWQDHIVRRINGRERPIELPARFQVVNDHWRQVPPDMPKIGYTPDLIYMQELDRLLLSMDCAHPGSPSHTILSTSDDRGATWSERRWLHTDPAESAPAQKCQHRKRLTSFRIRDLLFPW